MSKIKLSIIALSCVMALSACSSSSKGGTDNSEQIRQLESELNQKIAEATQKAEAAAKVQTQAVQVIQVAQLAQVIQVAQLAQVIQVEQKDHIHTHHLQT